MQFNRNPPVPIYESTTDVSLGWLSCHHSANALSVRFEVESSASDGRFSATPSAYTPTAVRRAHPVPHPARPHQEGPLVPYEHPARRPTSRRTVNSRHTHTGRSRLPTGALFAVLDDAVDAAYAIFKANAAKSHYGCTICAAIDADIPR